PKAAMATADVRKALDEFDRHYIFGHLIAELALYPNAQRRAMGHRQRCAVHIVGKDRLGVKGIVETNALVIPVYATFHSVGAVENHETCLGPDVHTLKQRRERRPGPLADAAPALDAVMTGDLGTGWQGAQVSQ